jgi:hypothetical protein
MYEELKSELQSIIELVETLPERYRERAFDLFVSQLLSGKEPSLKTSEAPGSGITDETPPRPPRREGSSVFIPPAKVRSFLIRANISEDQLRELVMVEDGEVHFIREPRNVRVSAGQIQWSLLLALQSALLGRDFLVDPEAVRSICQEKGFYDARNFSAYFKNNSRLYQRTPQPQGEAVRLSPDGEEQLANLIRSLVSQRAV